MVLWRGPDSSAWKTESKFNFIHIENTDVSEKY